MNKHEPRTMSPIVKTGATMLPAPLTVGLGVGVLVTDSEALVVATWTLVKVVGVVWVGTAELWAAEVGTGVL